MKHPETDLIKELLKSVEVLGVLGTANVLKLGRGNSITLDDKRVEFVLKMVAQHYDQTIDDIINSHNKSTKRMLAFRFAVYYLYDSFSLSYKDIGLIFKRHKSMLCRASKEIIEMTNNNKVIKKQKQDFDVLVNDYKTKNNL